LEKTIKTLEFMPTFIAFIYLSLFNFVQTEAYYNMYHTAEVIDNLLVSVCTICFLLGGYKSWNLISIRSYSVVVSLNILSEVSQFINLTNYYTYYLAILYLFILSFTITALSSKTELENDFN